ncbi:hypothetical protein EUGRSUZ_E02280 [Eucalyptus grandis]|uniref:Uncharacterized protein n=2 Tax=Eucalyptus grandis TaxID=71139 RepID=A0ACC3KXR2_EUCGR|nr:hypothetical protein EUGRSUZ_E02280 [Eucalyptus grandis]
MTGTSRLFRASFALYNKGKEISLLLRRKKNMRTIGNPRGNQHQVASGRNFSVSICSYYGMNPYLVAVRSRSCESCVAYWSQTSK